MDQMLLDGVGAEEISRKHGIHVSLTICYPILSKWNTLLRIIMQHKICRYCQQLVKPETAAYKNGLLRNECKPCRARIAREYNKLNAADKLMPCQECTTPCVRKFAIAFCSEKCRFMGYIKKEQSEGKNICWIWQGKKGQDGYGQIMIEGIRIRAHRYSYEIFKKKIDDGMLILHACHTKLCVNPDHLREGTVLENAEDTIASGNHLFGQTHPMAKLRNDDVLSIKNYYENGWSFHKISKKYNISSVQVRNIILGRNWKHLE